MEGYVNLLEETKDLSLIKKIKAILANCSSMVNDIENQALRPPKSKPETIKLSDILNELCGRYNKVENISLIVQGDAEVIADSNLRSVFENLIHNAIKHGKTEKIAINILKDERNIVVEILDESRITTADMERIRKQLKSYQIEKATGLGIVGKLLEIYRAKIDISQNEDLGIKIRIVFPKPKKDTV